MCLPDFNENVRARLNDHLTDFDNSDIVLVGEVHQNSVYAEAEGAITEKTQPEYILHEGLNDFEPDRIEPSIDAYSLVRNYDRMADTL